MNKPINISTYEGDKHVWKASHIHTMNMQIILTFIDGRGNENFIYSLNFELEHTIN